MSDTTKAARDERPASVETGQRWKTKFSTWTIGGRLGESSKQWSCTNETGELSQANEDWMRANATFLGYAPGHGPPQSQVAVGWEVGQRRRGKYQGGEGDARHGDFVVSHQKYGTAGQWWLTIDGVNHTGAHACESWPSTLLTEPPATPVTSGVPGPTHWECSADDGGARTNFRRCIYQPCKHDGGEREHRARRLVNSETGATLELHTGWIKLDKPSKPPLREVSPDGKAWINYDRLTDSDAFEAYRWRRLDGVVAAMVEATGVRIVGTYEGNAADDEYAAEQTRALDAARIPASKPLPLPQSHATTWGGVWSLRAPDVDVRR